MAKYRSSHWRCSKKVGVTKNFANVTGKHLCWSIILIKFQAGLNAYNSFKKRLQYRCVPVKVVKFLRTPTLKNICKRVLLKVDILKTHFKNDPVTASSCSYCHRYNQVAADSWGVFRTQSNMHGRSFCKNNS